MSEIVLKNMPCRNFAMNMIKEFDMKETAFWDMNMRMGPNVPIVLYYPVNKTSEEGAIIVNYLEWKASKFNYKIHEIWRIQNPYLMASYLTNKTYLIDEQGQHRVHSRLVLHGTQASNVDSIAYENFNLKNIKRHRYGHGIHFTTDIIFASKFCDRTPIKTLIVANTFVAITCEGHENMIVPKEGCDTSINKTPNNQNIIVKYDDDTFYPAYKVLFTCK